MFNTEIIAFLMLGGFFIMLMIGIPVAISLATVGFVFGFIGFGDTLFNLLPARVFRCGWRLSMVGNPIIHLHGNHA